MALARIGRCSRAAVPNLFGTKDWFPGKQFFHGLGWGVVSGWFKHLTLTVHCISIITVSAPPQILRHEILEVGGPWTRERLSPTKGLWSVKRQIEGSWSLSCIVLVLRFLLSGSWWSNIRKMRSLLMCANQFRKDILPGEFISDLRCSGSHLRNQPLSCFLYFPFPRDHRESLHCEVMDACRPLALAMDLFLKGSGGEF